VCVLLVVGLRKEVLFVAKISPLLFFARHLSKMALPRVFFDIHIGGNFAGKIVMEVSGDAFVGTLTQPCRLPGPRAQ